MLLLMMLLCVAVRVCVCLCLSHIVCPFFSLDVPITLVLFCLSVIFWASWLFLLWVRCSLFVVSVATTRTGVSERFSFFFSFSLHPVLSLFIVLSAPLFCVCAPPSPQWQPRRTTMTRSRRRPLPFCARANPPSRPPSRRPTSPSTSAQAWFSASLLPHMSTNALTCF